MMKPLNNYFSLNLFMKDVFDEKFPNGLWVNA